MCWLLIMPVSLQIIAFDELRTDFKNPIEQGNPSRAVSFFYFFHVPLSIAEQFSSCGIEQGEHAVYVKIISDLLYLSACFFCCLSPDC